MPWQSEIKKTFKEEKQATLGVLEEYETDRGRARVERLKLCQYAKETIGHCCPTMRFPIFSLNCRNTTDRATKVSAWACGPGQSAFGDCLERYWDLHHRTGCGRAHDHLGTLPVPGGMCLSLHRPRQGARKVTLAAAEANEVHLQHQSTEGSVGQWTRSCSSGVQRRCRCPLPATFSSSRVLLAGCTNVLESLQAYLAGVGAP